MGTLVESPKGRVWNGQSNAEFILSPTIVSTTGYPLSGENMMKTLMKSGQSGQRKCGMPGFDIMDVQFMSEARSTRFAGAGPSKEHVTSRVDCTQCARLCVRFS